LSTVVRKSFREKVPSDWYGSSYSFAMRRWHRPELFKAAKKQVALLEELSGEMDAVDKLTRYVSKKKK